MRDDGYDDAYDADEFYDMADDDDAFESGRLHGIREGERRMLRGIAVGAAWDLDRYERWMEQAGRSDFFRGRADIKRVACEAALRALRDLGDEDASRVLGERGW